MKSRKITLLTITALLLIVGALTTATVFAAGAVKQDATVHKFSDQSVVGSADLVRNNNGVSLRLETSMLPEAPTTVWWVVFDNPAGCIVPNACSLDDLADAAKQAAAHVAVGFASGHVVGKNGIAKFGAHLSVGDTTGFLFDASPADEQGLTNPLTAEIHVVLQTHGDKIPGSVAEQIHTFLGGCPPNACADIQFAVFGTP